ncbi:TetR/AcrR family transcriptional regulator [Microbacterium hatanonis]|uniref:TetR/AcrR family transcriptional regulator n=1 Tax=Microbacterium hatanonis TaxID=404366 RepID=A0A5C8I294_9MICO|nr:TetR/AcrR family transcriptional regulator [Microbacterium hatanonis]TXK12331.1 TetR/AcrR family transcriptional regulator [Microbacterium hatanonis]
MGDYRRGRRTYLQMDDRREQLLDAAVDVMVDDGVSALSLRSVADRVDVSHRVVTYAFGSKAGLVAALVERESNKVIVQAWSAPLLDMPLDVAATAAIRAVVDVVRANPRRHECLAELMTTVRATPEHAETFQKQARVHREEITARVEEWAHARGAELPTTTPTLVTALQVAARGAIEQWLSTRDDASLTPAIELLVAGFRATALR